MHEIGQGEIRYIVSFLFVFKNCFIVIRYIVSLAYPFRDILQLHKICVSRFISSPQMKAYDTLSSIPCFAL